MVAVAERGYGSACRGGVEGARGRYLILGDSDDSYDFGELPRFVERLRAGAELVMGSRFLGRIVDGAVCRGRIATSATRSSPVTAS